MLFGFLFVGVCGWMTVQRANLWFSNDGQLETSKEISRFPRSGRTPSDRVGPLLRVVPYSVCLLSARLRRKERCQSDRGVEVEKVGMKRDGFVQERKRERSNGMDLRRRDRVWRLKEGKRRRDEEMKVKCFADGIKI